MPPSPTAASSSASALWITESSTPQQRLGGVLLCVGGLVLVWGFRGAEGSIFSSGDQAGFWLGVMVLVGGATLLLFGGQTTITVDPRRRLITVAHVNWLRQKRRVLRFDDIVELSLGEVGDDEGGSTRYHVAARLRDGRELALFHGFFEGSTQATVMQARLDRLQQILRDHPRPPAR